jgi:hypothetical protein
MLSADALERDIRLFLIDSTRKLNAGRKIFMSIKLVS